MTPKSSRATRRTSPTHTPPNEGASDAPLLADHQHEAPFAGDDVDASNISTDAEYAIRDGRICRVGRDRVGHEILAVLAHFVALIDEELVPDEGDGSRLFRVVGYLPDGKSLPALVLTAEDFDKMRWPLTRWGANARTTGRGSLSVLRDAIQSLSSPREQPFYSSTGWKRHGATWVFAHAGGAIGADGVNVRLDANLKRFEFPHPHAPEEAMGLVFDLLNAGPLHVTVPLVSAAFLAILSEWIRPSFGVWLHGESGSLKSEYAALLQSFFGEFNSRTPLTSFHATENANLEILHKAKDVIGGVDDFAANADRHRRAELTRHVEFIVRAAGNGAGRQRMGGGARTVDEGRAPRGLLLVTAEETLLEASLRARLVEIGVGRDTFDRPLISKVQESRSRLRHAMAGFLAWMQPRAEEIGTQAQIRATELRTTFSASRQHPRAADNLAALMCGAELAFGYAHESGAITDDERKDWEDRAVEALREVGRRQERAQQHADPIERWVEHLRDLFTQGRVTVVSREHELHEVSTPGREAIGWIDGDSAALLPEATTRAVGRSMREAGEHTPLAGPALTNALVRIGLIGRAAEGRMTHVLRVGISERARVWRVPLERLGLEHAVDNTPTPLEDRASEASAVAAASPPGTGRADVDALSPRSPLSPLLHAPRERDESPSSSSSPPSPLSPPFRAPCESDDDPPF